MYIYSFFFCFYWCKDYCHRVITQFQLVLVVVLVVVVVVVEVVITTTLQHIQGNRGTIGQTTWYEHVPKSVQTSQGGKVTILWNQVQPDRTIPNNKPEIVKRDNVKGTCVLIDVAISGDRNVIKKEAEKIL